MFNIVERLVKTAQKETKANNSAIEQSEKQVNRNAKQAKLADKYLTKTFSHLANNLDISLKAIKYYNGELTQNIGGANHLKGYLKSGFGWFVRDVSEVDREQIVSNHGYKTYQETLKEQGYQVSVSGWTDSDSRTMSFERGFGGPFVVGFVILASNIFPVNIVSTCLLFTWGTGLNACTAKIKLQLSEIEPKTPDVENSDNAVDRAERQKNDKSDSFDHFKIT